MQIIAIAIRGILWPNVLLSFILFPYYTTISQTIFDFLKLYLDEIFQNGGLMPISLPLPKSLTIWSNKDQNYKKPSLIFNEF